MIILLLLVSSRVLVNALVNSYILMYESNTKLWKVCEKCDNWQQYNTLSAMYINQWFVWIVLSNSDNKTKGLIIGRDSLPSERYLQLRRCILCPEVVRQTYI